MSEQCIAIVTGATRGIGKSIASALGAAGMTVVGTATSESGAQTISASLEEQNISGTGKKLDVTDADAVAKFVKTVIDEFGVATVLVNNAGITRDNLVIRMQEDDWDAIIDTNLKSVFRLSKALVRGMSKARFGRIINISSVVGATGNAGQANYAAAKAGLIGFTKSLAAEVAGRNITVNAVAPGFIQTDMTAKLSREQAEALVSRIPLGRYGSADDIAYAVSFLASGQASYITGATLHVNGGMFMNS